MVGGGPAGSTVSTLLAQHGLKVKLYEREKFPRFHIGESLIPETYWVFKRLDMLDKMKASPFVKKFSVQFVNAAGQGVGPVLLPRQQAARVLADLASDPQRVRHSDARQRPRTRRRGPSSRAACSKSSSTATGRSASASRTRTASRRTVHAKVVVDASGQSTMLQNRFKLRLWDPVLNKGAIWTYWRGRVPRHAAGTRGRRSSSRRRTSRAGGGTSRSTTTPISVGVVAPFDYLFKGRGTHEQIYNEEVAACPPCRSGSPAPSARPATSPPRTTRTARSRWPATAGCSSATPSASSIRSTRPACCSR